MYTRAQKESSSVSATSIHKKNNGSDGSHSFSVQRQPEINSSQEKHIASYSRNAADSLITNVMRSMEAREQREEAQGHKRQEESRAASVAQVVMPKPELPIAPVASVSQPLGEMGIQRQCSACEQGMEEGKDSDEMSSVAGVQTKLTVGAVGDKYEQEADRVAAQVMSMSVTPDHSPQVQRFGEEDNPVQRWSLAQSITPVVQRQVDEQVQMRELVQRAFQAGGNQASGDLEGRLNASKGGGSALAPEVRAFMEPRFGADFSSVRVHTGGEAVQMNRELGAQAFAHGSDVYFGAGKSPGNNELTAHELTHVVQQTGAVQRQSRGTAGATAPPPVQQQARTIDGSAGSVSWINPASPAGSGRLGVPDPAPPATISESFITGSSGFRFSNYLHGYLTTNDSVTIASAGLHSNSGIYTSPSQFGLPSERFPTISSKTNITRGSIQGVQFNQLVGARTISAGIAAGTVGTTVGIGTGIWLGVKGGAAIGALGGPIGAVGGGIVGGLLGAGAGYLAGTATANNIPQTNFPPIWTEIQLTIMADGTRDFQMLRHSLFPSNSFYSNPIGASTLVRTSNYSALASQETAWQNGGWGSGNPWGMNRPTFTP